METLFTTNQSNQPLVENYAIGHYSDCSQNFQNKEIYIEKYFMPKIQISLS